MIGGMDEKDSEVWATVRVSAHDVDLLVHIFK